MDKYQLNSLIDKVNQGTATDEELLAYTAYLNQITSGKEEWDLQNLGSAEEVKAELLHRIEERMDEGKVRGMVVWYRIVAAASVLLFLSVGGYFLLHKQPTRQTAQHQNQDIAPGGNKAILTLANGKKISLSDAKNGTIAKENQVAINKTANGQVVYTATATATTTATSPATFNSIETPRGGQYHLTLADGTQVWLNSASSIKYPSAFTGQERKVELTGEAYFEVAHNSAMPFRVIAAGETVEDLGTHFNINAYTDEPAIKTTLLEGNVRISKNGHMATLKPGQQALVADNENNINVKNTDIEEAVAWKNGYFIFDNENIHSVMRKLSRWYDVEPEYAPNIPEIGFGGTISRNKNISEILKVLELTNSVHFKIEGRSIRVMP